MFDKTSILSILVTFTGMYSDILVAAELPFFV